MPIGPVTLHGHHVGLEPPSLALTRSHRRKL